MTGGGCLLVMALVCTGGELCGSFKEYTHQAPYPADEISKNLGNVLFPRFDQDVQNPFAIAARLAIRALGDNRQLKPSTYIGFGIS